MTIETLLNISEKLDEPSSKPKGVYAELRVKRIDDFSLMVFLYSYVGHVLPGIVYRFDTNGKQTKKKIKIPNYTIFLISLAYLWAILLMISNPDNISSWSTFIFPTILTIAIIGGGYYFTNRKLNTIKKQLDN